MWNGWIIGILGVWAFIAPFIGLTPMGFAWSHWIVGVVAGVLGYAMLRSRAVEGWITGIAASWLFISGFIPGLRAGPGVWWNNLIVGAILAIFGFVAARTTRPAPTTQAQAR